MSIKLASACTAFPRGHRNLSHRRDRSARGGGGAVHQHGKFSLGAGAQFLAIARRHGAKCLRRCRESQRSKFAQREFVGKFYDRLVPGIDGEFDGPAMIVKIAPRPLMTINGDSDPRTPLAGLKLCTDAAQAAYHAAGADDHFVVRIEEKTGHKVNPDAQSAAVDWFVKWLKP